MYRPRILNAEVEKLHVVVETMCYFFLESQFLMKKQHQKHYSSIKLEKPEIRTL